MVVGGFLVESGVRNGGYRRKDRSLSLRACTGGLRFEENMEEGSKESGGVKGDVGDKKRMENGEEERWVVSSEGNG